MTIIGSAKANRLYIEIIMERLPHTEPGVTTKELVEEIEARVPGAFNSVMGGEHDVRALLNRLKRQGRARRIGRDKKYGRWVAVTE